ncbi:MAG TPA: hypothetical protein VFY65_06560 [Longimicrobium sp.]|nr:hypothetical protein [Longimicrobium sp.]
MRTRDPAARLARFVLLAAVLAAGCDAPGVPESRVPAVLQMVHGDTQTAVAGQTLADSLELRVLNRGGQPVPGVEVEFSSAAGGGTLQPARARTDAGGIARAAWTLGPTAGAQTAQGRVSEGRLDALVFTARATPGAPARLIEAGGSGQAGVVGEPLPQPLAVRVVDAFGNGVAGIPVMWEQYDDCSVLPESELSDSSGFSRATLTLGTGAGFRAVTAVATDDTLWFNVEVLPGPLVRVEITGDGPRLHPTSSRLEAAAFDAYGNPVPAAALTWESSDPSVAVVDPDPDPPRATVSSRGGGTVRISAIAGGVAGTREFRVQAVNGSFTAVNTGLERADALNGRGELARLIDRTTLGIWSGGSESRFSIAEVAPPCGACHEYNVIAGFNAEGVVAIMRVYAANPSLYNDRHGWLWKDGVLGSIRGTIRELNEHGQVAGYTHNNTFTSQPIDSAFLWHGNQLQWLTGIAVRDEYGRYGHTAAVAMNDHGQVAVNTTRCSDFDCYSRYTRAYVWEAGTFTPVPRPDDSCVAWEAVDINNPGHVLVRCTRGSNAVFVWDGTAFTGVSLQSPRVLNDRGEVVAWEGDGPYLWRNGQRTRLLDEPMRVTPTTTTVLINDRGQILLNLPYGAFLLTPLP